MKTKDKRRVLNYTLTFLIILMLLAGIALTLYYFNYQKNTCLGNPLVYGAKQLTDKYGVEFQGSGFFRVPPGYSSPLINFNSTSISVQK